MKATTRALAIAGAFALAAGALTGCSSTPPMTQEEACAYLETETSTYLDSMEQKYKDAAAIDSGKAAQVEVEMLDKMDSMGNSVGHAEVKASFKKSIAAIRDFLTLSQKAEKDPSSVDGDEATKTMAAVTEAGVEFAKFCPNGTGLVG